MYTLCDFEFTNRETHSLRTASDTMGLLGIAAITGKYLEIPFRVGLFYKQLVDYFAD